VVVYLSILSHPQTACQTNKQTQRRGKHLPPQCNVDTVQLIFFYKTKHVNETQNTSQQQQQQQQKKNEKQKHKCTFNINHCEFAPENNQQCQLLFDEVRCKTNSLTVSFCICRKTSNSPLPTSSHPTKNEMSSYWPNKTAGCGKNTACTLLIQWWCVSVFALSGFFGQPPLPFNFNFIFPSFFF